MNPFRIFIFRLIDGIWQDVNTGCTLAEVLGMYSISIDDRTQFARLYDYDEGWVCWYRAYSAGKITMTFYPWVCV